MAKNRQKKSHWGLFIVLAILIAAAVAGLAVYKKIQGLFKIDTAYKPESTELVHVVVPSGSSTSRIAAILEENGIVENADVFKLYTKLNDLDGKFQAGEYELSASMTTEELFYQLQHAYRDTVRFTIPEGYTIKQTAEKLAAEGLVGSADEFIKATEADCYTYWFNDEIGSGENAAEGFLFPNTYEIFKDATAEQIVSKMMAGFDSVYTSKFRTRAKELGLSTKEVVTIASLIEKETRTAEERPLVSSVIYNRIDQGMKLQFCSTVQYAMGEWKPRLLYKDLEIDSPYNTYIIDGLPPGPICSPGQGSIEAALYPEDTDYLYFVLKGDGSKTHNFSSNYKDFSNNKQDYIDTIE